MPLLSPASATDIHWTSSFLYPATDSRRKGPSLPFMFFLSQQYPWIITDVYLLCHKLLKGLHWQEFIKWYLTELTLMHKPCLPSTYCHTCDSWLTWTSPSHSLRSVGNITARCDQYTHHFFAKICGHMCYWSFFNFYSLRLQGTWKLHYCYVDLFFLFNQQLINKFHRLFI